MDEQFLTKAIVLFSEDYKEKDKLVTIFSVDRGLMTATLKGCRNKNAKLKFLASPFCFAEVLVNQKSNFKTIINATCLDSFFDLSKNYDDFLNASVMLEIAQNVVKFDEPNYPIFIALLSSLKAICYEGKNANMVLAKFCLNALQNLGYKLSFSSCQGCGMPFLGDKFLDMSSGEFVCANCKNMASEKISNAGFNALKIIDSTEIDRLSTIKLKDDILREILSLLLCNIECRTERTLKSKKNVVNFA